LRLPHQEQRHGEHREGEQLYGFVRERHDAADEAVDEVVGKQPRKPLPEDRPPALVSLKGERQGDETHVHGEVRRAREQAEPRGRQLMSCAVREEVRHLEDARRRQRCERQCPDVEEDVV
jgi:hypothetical protein